MKHLRNHCGKVVPKRDMIINIGIIVLFNIFSLT